MNPIAASAPTTPGGSTLLTIGMSFLCYLTAGSAISEIFASQQGPMVSLLISSVCLFCAAIPLLFSRVQSGLRIGRIPLLGIIALLFGLKLGAGILHYLHFIEPEYFKGATFYTYLWDFEWIDRSMVLISEHWHVNGLFSAWPADYVSDNKNQYLLAFMGLNYFVFGAFPMNIVPWNILMGLYTALLVTDIACEMYAECQPIRTTFILAILLPFNWIASFMWRDTTGQFWVVLGVYLLYVTRKKLVWWIVCVPIAAFLAYSHRQPYLLLIIYCSLLYLTLRFARSKYNVIWLFFGGILCVAAFPALRWLNGTSMARFDDSYKGMYLGGNGSLVIGMPFRVLRGIVGPFPWTQYFLKVAGYEYQPDDYGEHVLNVALLWVCVPDQWKRWKGSKNIDFLFAFAAFFFLSGVIAVGIHSSYVSVAMVMLIPLAAYRPPAYWFTMVSLWLLVFVLLNVTYNVLGLAGGNHIQNISGGY